MKIYSVIYGVFFVLLAAACSHQDGQQNTNNSGESPAIGECLYDETPLEWDTASPEAIVPDAIMEFAGGEFIALPAEASFDDYNFSVTFTIERADETAYYKENIGGGCFAMVELPIQIMFRTEHRPEFNENIVTRGVVTSLEPGKMVINAGMDIDSLAGSYSPIPPEGSNIRGLSLRLEMTAEGGSGAIILLLEGKNGDTAWAGQEPQITWQWEN